MPAFVSAATDKVVLAIGHCHTHLYNTIIMSINLFNKYSNLQKCMHRSTLLQKLYHTQKL